MYILISSALRNTAGSGSTKNECGSTALLWLLTNTLTYRDMFGMPPDRLHALPLTARLGAAALSHIAERLLLMILATGDRNVGPVGADVHGGLGAEAVEAEEAGQRALLSRLLFQFNLRRI